jgi:hypothetical protein
MPLALWTLLWLNARAGVRRMGRQARSVRGVVFLVLGLMVVATWVARMVYLNGPSSAVSPANLRATAPVAILGFCVMNLFASFGERAVTFSPAEVDFLFPGPFTRRQLLTYKLVKTGLGGVVSAVIFSRILIRHGGSYWSGVVGIWLTFQFIQVVAMVAALLQTTIGERVFTAGRRWALLALVAVAVATVAPAAWAKRDLGAARLAADLRASPVGRWVLAPFTVFANAITADRFFPDGLRWDAVGLAMDAALVGVVLALDANYLETAATASAKRYARVSRVRRVGLAGTANAGSARLRVPVLPWLAGAGPVAWRQLTGVLRTGRGLLVVVAIVACAGGGTFAHAGRDPQSLLSLVVVSMGINLFLSSLLKFDFRGDLDHLDVLRSLPLRPTAVAAGEVLAPTLVLSAVQGLLLTAAVVWGHVPAAWVWGAAAFVVPLNALLVSTENLLFLLFPSRQAAAVAGDMGMVGRQSVVLMCRLLALLLMAGLSVGCGAVTYWVTGRSMVAAVAAAWAVLASAVAVVVGLLGLVYDRFDPSVDSPT